LRTVKHAVGDRLPARHGRACSPAAPSLFETRTAGWIPLLRTAIRHQLSLRGFCSCAPAGAKLGRNRIPSWWERKRPPIPASNHHDPDAKRKKKGAALLREGVSRECLSQSSLFGMKRCGRRCVIRAHGWAKEARKNFLQRLCSSCERTTNVDPNHRAEGARKKKNKRKFVPSNNLALPFTRNIWKGEKKQGLDN